MLYEVITRYGKDMKKFGGVTEPLGIAYIAGYLETKGIPVRIIDAQAEDLTADAVVACIMEQKESLVGIFVLTPVFNAARDLCRRIKAARITSYNVCYTKLLRS